MHAQTARRNGGDYDFDYICVVESQKFPHWVEDRFNYQERFSNQKQKLSKRRSPWWKLPQVAMAAKGNSIGSITDLKTSALAAGRPDLAEELALELQAALDQLKHGTEPNQERITAIRKEVGAAPWLKSKLAKRVEDLPLHFDNVGSWLQALHSKVCQGQGIGSIVFYAFPQELVDGIVERTGGRPIMVRVPDLAEGEVEIGQDGEVFLVSRFTGPDGEAHERRILYLQITEGGDLYMDQKHGRPVLIEKVRPFKVIPGRSEIRDGRLVMPGTAQRPAVPVRKAQLNEPPGGPYLGLLRDNNREGTEVIGRRAKP